MKTKMTRERAQNLEARDWGGLTREEVAAVVCKYFCRGFLPKEIREQVEKAMRIKLTREDCYRLLSFAASRGWIRFHASLDHDLMETMGERYSFLSTATVVRTGVSDDVSFHLATDLMKEVRTLVRSENRKSELHLGFAGGSALRKAARHFAEMLREPHEDLPRRIVFHAMVAGFNFRETPADPNSFFGYFAGEPALQVETSFVGLHAPGLAPTNKIPMLRSLDYIREAYERAREIDIVVTSAGGHWQQGHSLLYEMYKRGSPQSLAQLTKLKCLGDMMWRPFGPEGPLEVATEVRAMTLLELSELPGMVRNRKRVFLLLGPCGSCGGPKTEVLRAVLHHTPQLITHLVADSRSVRDLMGGTPVPGVRRAAAGRR